MRKFRNRRLILLAILIIGSLSPLLAFSGVIPVRAGTLTYDFTVSDQGWDAVSDTFVGCGYGTWATYSNHAWNGVPSVCSGSQTTDLWIRYNFGSTEYVTSVDITYSEIGAFTGSGSIVTAAPGDQQSGTLSQGNNTTTLTFPSISSTNSMDVILSVGNTLGSSQNYLFISEIVVHTSDATPTNTSTPNPSVIFDFNYATTNQYGSTGPTIASNGYNWTAIWTGSAWDMDNERPDGLERLGLVRQPFPSTVTVATITIYWTIIGCTGYSDTNGYFQIWQTGHVGGSNPVAEIDSPFCGTDNAIVNFTVSNVDSLDIYAYAFNQGVTTLEINRVVVHTSTAATFTPTPTGTVFTITPPPPCPTNVPSSTPTAITSTPTTTPTLTGSETNTPTPAITPCRNPTPVVFNHCAFLGDDVANFANMPGQWSARPTDSPPGNPPHTNTGLFLGSGSASYSLRMNSSHKYTLEAKWHVFSVGSGVSTFTLGLGSTITPVTIKNSVSVEQSIQVPASNYSPDQNVAGVNLFTLVVGRSSQGSNPSIVVDFVCVTDTSSPGINPNPVIDSAGCVSCTYQPVTVNGLGDIVDNIIRLIQWLFCGLGRLWGCVFYPIFYGIWQFIGGIWNYVKLLGVWFSSVFTDGSNWFITIPGIIASWLGGAFSNIAIGIYNFLSPLFSNGAFLGSFISTVGNLFLLVIQFAINGVRLVVAIIGYGLQMIGLIIQIIIGVVTAFNQSSSGVPIYAPACDTPGQFFYWPCLGFYVLDNTIWDGPLYYLVYASMGIIGYRFILWIKEYVQEQLAKTQD